MTIDIVALPEHDENSQYSEAEETEDCEYRDALFCGAHGRLVR